ncbi:MAG: hypothetical protein HY827_09070 [Actinobacteria bacterium]|nr:hypothetical protein [Actinomycetota bacterium]
MINDSVVSARLYRAAILVGTLTAALMMFAWIGATGASAEAVIAVTAGPSEGSFTNASPVSFSLSAPVADTKVVDFYCSMDNTVSFSPCDNVAYPTCVAAGAGVLSCTQTKSFTTLTEGAHTFRTFASECDAPCDPFDTGTDGPMITRSFTVDRTAPTVSLLSGPSTASPLLQGVATFTFSSNEPGSFTCAVGIAGATPCASPLSTTDFANGQNSVTIRAIDRAGNTSAPLVQNYTVDIFKPKKCKKPRGQGAKRASAKAKYRRCVKANSKAKALWKKKHGVR